ncbi:hypothetical protein Nepgr_033012 [Nepenthes gracilis]|uniref:Uncharacterized protein n=1 Tax=Nepenthes gracilis TaxID=150966 RepID=A0AAD3Y8C5_NEPGR|nr:hypothetical protein Nepgr_033012 [Nepenthes gracilis]
MLSWESGSSKEGGNPFWGCLIAGKSMFVQMMHPHTSEPGTVVWPPSGHGAPRGASPARRGPMLVGERRSEDLQAMLERGSQQDIFCLLQSMLSLCG